MQSCHPLQVLGVDGAFCHGAGKEKLQHLQLLCWGACSHLQRQNISGRKEEDEGLALLCGGFDLLVYDLLSHHYIPAIQKYAL